METSRIVGLMTLPSSTLKEGKETIWTGSQVKDNETWVDEILDGRNAAVRPTKPKRSVYRPACPTRKALERVADRWTGLVVGRLAGGTKRFGELLRGIDGVTQKMLTQTLRSLERDGLVERRVYPVVPPRVEYTLTLLGRTLIEPLEAISSWATEHIGEILACQEAYDEKTRGHGDLLREASA